MTCTQVIIYLSTYGNLVMSMQILSFLGIFAYSCDFPDGHIARLLGYVLFYGVLSSQLACNGCYISLPPICLPLIHILGNNHWTLILYKVDFITLPCSMLSTWWILTCRKFCPALLLYQYLGNKLFGDLAVRIIGQGPNDYLIIGVLLFNKCLFHLCHHDNTVRRCLLCNIILNNSPHIIIPIEASEQEHH